MHFDVTTEVPYFTLGHTIDAIGYHPTTEVPNSCEKIYQVRYVDLSSFETMETFWKVNTYSTTETRVIQFLLTLLFLLCFNLW